MNEEDKYAIVEPPLSSWEREAVEASAAHAAADALPMQVAECTAASPVPPQAESATRDTTSPVTHSNGSQKSIEGSGKRKGKLNKWQGEWANGRVNGPTSPATLNVDGFGSAYEKING